MQQQRHCRSLRKLPKVRARAKERVLGKKVATKKGEDSELDVEEEQMEDEEPSASRLVCRPRHHESMTLVRAR